MADRNKIAQSLSTEELHAFIDRCWETQGLTLAKVQELAAEIGISVSLMGAKSFRDTTYQKHIDRIRRARDLAEQVSELKRVAPGHTLADAASDILSQEVLDAMTNRDPDQELDLDVMSKIVKRLRDGDSKAKGLQVLVDRLKLAQLDAAKIAIQKAAEIKAITSDTALDSAAKLEHVRQLLFGGVEEE